MQPLYNRLSLTKKRSVLLTAPAEAKGRHNGWQRLLLSSNLPVVQLLAVHGHRRLTGINWWVESKRYSGGESVV
jgi:hypothetical protein